MANANVNLPYGVTKQIRIAGKNAANTSERPITNITFGASFGTVTITPTGDPQIFSVVNTNQTANTMGTINWTAKNELNQTINGTTPITLIAADPAVTIESTEL